MNSSIDIPFNFGLLATGLTFTSLFHPSSSTVTVLGVLDLMILALNCRVEQVKSYTYFI
jgi:hypothetical protein